MYNTKIIRMLKYLLMQSMNRCYEYYKIQLKNNQTEFNNFEGLYREKFNCKRIA